jgi:hypothetical protein
MKNALVSAALATAISIILVQAQNSASAASPQLGPDESLIPASQFTTPDGRMGHPFKLVENVAPLSEGALQGRYTTSNWAGQVAADSTHNFLTVASYFTIPPSILCDSHANLFAAWIGLNGYSNGTVQQAGVAVNCGDGNPVLQAWYEMYPLAPVYISPTTYPIHLGDHMSYWIENESGQYHFFLTDNGPDDLAQVWIYKTVQTGPTTASSAEAVVESPPNSYPNFSTLEFSVLGGNDTPGEANALFTVGPPSDDLPPIIPLNAASGGVTEVTTSGINYSEFNSPL